MYDLKCETYLDQTFSMIISGPLFNGKNVKTLENEFEEDEKYHRGVVVEELISMISEPGSGCFCHFTTSR